MERNEVVSQYLRAGWRQAISFTHMSIQNGGEVHTGHKDVVAHVLFAPGGLRCTEVGGDGDSGRTRYIASVASLGTVDIQ